MAGLAATGAWAKARRAKNGEYLMYVGTYTNTPKSKGVYAYRFQSANGQTTPIGLVGETTNPSYVVLHPNGRWLYAANEVGNFGGQKSGAVTAFSVNSQNGQLTQLNQVSSRGDGPCYLSVDKTGKNVLVANYGGGSVAVLPVQTDGKLKESSAFVQHSGSGPNPQRQKGPHGHSIDLSPDNRFALVDDLGLDEILVYRFDPNAGTLSPNDPPFVKAPPGGGPRHLAFGKNGKFVYGANEMGSSLTVYSYNAKQGSLQQLQTVSLLPKHFQGENTAAEIHVHPNGRFVYASNRGNDSIAVFAIDEKTGLVTIVEHTPTQGKVPRNFTIDPTGNYLFAANQNSDNVVAFKLDPSNGRLKPTGSVLDVGAPVCIQFLPVR